MPPSRWLNIVGIVLNLAYSAKEVMSAASATRVEEWPEGSILETLSASTATYTPFVPGKPDSNRNYPAEPTFTEMLYTMQEPSIFRFQENKGQFVKMPIWMPKSVTSKLPASGTQPDSRSIFTFQFRTSQTNGLLLYFDDGGPRDYVQLALRNRVLELRFRFGAAQDVKVRVGNSLNDRRWHSVSMEISGIRVNLRVDGQRVVGAAQGRDASPIIPRSFCYLGGIPSVYKLSDLSLPSVFFEVGLRGAIRRYAIDGKYQKPLEKYLVVEEVGSDQCYTERNPCKNNGQCFVLNNEPACDCSETKFSGIYCEETNDEAAATFLGKQWFEYDMTTKPISSYEDTITFFFKTKQSNGLMLHTGKSADYVNLSIKNGAISLVVNLGSGAYEVLLNPRYQSFNDNKWHFLKLHRELRRGKSNDRLEGASVTSPNTSSVMKSSPPSSSLFPTLPSVCLWVNLTVDNAEMESGVTQNDYTQLTLDDVFYIGGSPSTATLPGSVATNNFIGCMKEVTYKNSDSIFQFSRMANDGNPNLKVVGGVQSQCEDIDVSGPVTFKTPNSYIKIPRWTNSETGGMKLEFKTTEPNGLLFFGFGNASRDFFALELFEGNLYVLINLGSGVKKQRCPNSQALNDGNWHSIKVMRHLNQLTISIGNQDVKKSLEGENTNLDLDGPMYLGGAEFDALADAGRLPRGLFTLSLKYGFVGCMRQLYVDGVGMDLKALAKDTYRDPSSIGPECENLGRSNCAAQPCKNGGRCSEGWNRFTCDCTETPFRGETCELAVSTVGFNGSQSLRLPSRKTKRTQAEEISFRFKTPLSFGLLFTTTSDNTADRLTVKLMKGGQVKLTVDIDCFKKNCTAPRARRPFAEIGLMKLMTILKYYGLREEANNLFIEDVTNRQGPDSIFQGQSLNDNKWHTVKIQRFGRRLTLTVDGKLTGLTGNSGLLTTGHTELQYDAIHLGKVTGPVVAKVQSDLGPPFVGLIQNLIFNKQPLIDRCFQDDISCQVSGTWGEKNIISNPITIGKNSWVAIDTLEAYSSMTLFFTLRTTVSDGLILYNAGRGGDFIAVELVEWYIRYTYNLGNGAQIISTPDQRNITDNRWHEIRISRDASNTHTLSVDGSKFTQEGSKGKRKLDLEGPLYIGGVRRDLYYNGLPDSVVSRFGFQGCLGTFDFNGFTPEVLGKNRIQMFGSVKPGCTGPTQACTENSCLNGGECRKEWSSYSCDCSMSSYVGRRCDKHISTMRGGVSYRFDNGVISYNWPSTSLPSQRRDTLGMGFATRERNCVLAKISSLDERTISDFMQLEIENGRLTLRFNIGSRGSRDVVLKEPKGVADGQYHLVVISRVWMNATMRVDNWPERTVEPNGNPRKRYDLAATSIPLSVRPEVDEWLRRKGTKNTVFNSQSLIQIGGLLTSDNSPSPTNRPTWPVERSNIVRPFKGLMIGFYFNEIEVFTLAERGSEQVTIKGSVNLIGDPPITPTPAGGINPTTMATMTTFSTSSTDPTLTESPGNDSECDQEEICSGEQGAGRGETMQGDDQTSQTTVNGSPKISTVEIVESSFNETNVNGSDNLRNGDNMVVDVKKSGFLSRLFSGTTAMIAGIVGAAVISILALLFAIYKYKHRDENVYHAGKGATNSNGHAGNGTANGHAGSIVRKNNGSVKANGKAMRGREVDKEYYV